MEIIKIEPYLGRDKEAAHFFIHAVVLHEKLGGNDVPTADKYEVEFKVNGVELPFQKTMQSVYELFRKDVEKVAGELLIEKASQEIFAVQDLAGEVLLILKKRAKELFNVDLEDE